MRRYAQQILWIILLFASNALAAEIEGVPFIRQDSQFCGPASLASVMTWYGVPADQKAIGSVVYSEKLQGALVTDLEHFARDAGFQARSGRGTLDQLKAFVDEGRPVIVLVDFGVWVFSRPHYLVVFGYDERGLVAHDGFEARRHFTEKRFLESWEKMGNVYLLVWRDKKGGTEP